MELKNYELTFERDADRAWTWRYVEAVDFHQAMLLALAMCPPESRVHGVLFLTAEQLAANKASAARRTGGFHV